MTEQDFCPYYKDKSCPYIEISVRCFQRYHDCFIYERTKTLRSIKRQIRDNKELGDKTG
jgi:hypothetical protein